MKKILFSLFSLCVAGLTAQNTLIPLNDNLSSAVQAKMPTTPARRIILNAQSGKGNPVTLSSHLASFKMDYYYYDYALQSGSTYANPDPSQVSQGFRTLFANMGSRIPSGAKQSMVKAAVAFDTIIHTEVDSLYPINSINSLTVDTIILSNFGHVNHSGLTDTLIFKVVALSKVYSNKNYPDTTKVLWTYKIATDTALVPGNALVYGGYYNITTFAIACGVTLPAGAQKFGVTLEYKQADIHDSLICQFGFSDEGNQCGIYAFKPLKSLTYPSTYVEHPSYRSLGFLPEPTSSGTNNIFTDCDGSPSTFEAGVDAYSVYQNLNLAAAVTINYLDGVNEISAVNGIKLKQNIPNPANGTTTIAYDLAKATTISLEVYDIAGNKVAVIDNGKMLAGSHNISLNVNQLNAGVYFYTLVAGENRLTRKMIITE